MMMTTTNTNVVRRAAGSALEPQSRPTLPGRRPVLDNRQICEECDNRPHYPNTSSHLPYLVAGRGGGEGVHAAKYKTLKFGGNQADDRSRDYE